MNEVKTPMRTLNGHTFVDQEARDAAAQNAAAVSQLSKEIGDVSGEFSAVYVMPEQYGAVGDGVTDDSAAIKAMFSSGYRRFFMRQSYLVKGEIGEAFHTFENVDGIDITTVDGSAIHYVANGDYTLEGHENPRTFFLRFNNCSNVNVKMNYVGDYADIDELGYYGTSAIGFSSCQHCNFQMSARNCRDVLWSYPMTGGEYSWDIVAKGNSVNCGYFFAGTGLKHVTIECDTSIVHRSIYLAAAENVRIYNTYDTQHIADYNVILTCGEPNGTCDGIKNVDAVIKDKVPADGTLPGLTSYACGVSLQQYDTTSGIRSVEFSNISVEVFKTVRGTGCLGISAAVEYDVTASNIELIVHDSRPRPVVDDGLATRVLRCTGDYCDRLPFRITGYTENESLLSNAVVTVDNLRGHSAMTNGNIIVRNNSIVRAIRPISLVIEDMYSFVTHLHEPKDCVFQGRDGRAFGFETAGTAVRDDLLQGKMMCVMWLRKDAYIRIHSFNESGSELKNMFEGVVRGGCVTPIFYNTATPHNHIRIYVPAEENAALGFDLTDFYASAVV